jgi:hypothetical protein
MNQQLESDVHDAFSAFASGIPAEASQRLRGIDYRPRTARLSPRLTAGVMIGAAATTTTIVSVVVLGGSQTAFAGWSPSPSRAPIVLTSSADDACQAQLANTPPGLSASATGPWTVVATDVRGPFTLVIYEDGDAHANCLTGPSVTVVSESMSTGGTTSVAQGSRAGGTRTDFHASAGSWFLVSGTGNNNSAGGLTNVVVAHLASTTQGPYTLVEGQTDPDVTGVTVVSSDGERVQATTDNGWFLAWWPGTQGAASAQISTAAGVTTQVFNTPPPPPPGDGSCVEVPQTTSGTTVCSVSGNSGTGAASTGTP